MYEGAAQSHANIVTSCDMRMCCVEIVWNKFSPPLSALFKLLVLRLKGFILSIGVIIWVYVFRVGGMTFLLVCLIAAHVRQLPEKWRAAKIFKRVMRTLNLVRGEWAVTPAITFSCDAFHNGIHYWIYIFSRFPFKGPHIHSWLHQFLCVVNFSEDEFHWGVHWILIMLIKFLKITDHRLF